MALPILCFFHFGFMTCQMFGTKSAQNARKMPFAAVFGKAIPLTRPIELLRVRQVLKVAIPGMVRVQEEIVGSRLFDALVFPGIPSGFTSEKIPSELHFFRPAFLKPELPAKLLVTGQK